MHNFRNIESPFLHFSFLKNIKVHGVYYDSLTSYINQYPIVKREHIHDFYTLILFTKGTGVVKVKNESFKAGSKTICLIAPNQVHSYDGLEETEGKVFFFCQDFYVEEFSYLRLLNTFFCRTQITGNIGDPCIDLTKTFLRSLLNYLNR